MRLPIIACVLVSLILILPVFVAYVESGTSTNTLYAHAETTTISGVNYYLHKLSATDGPATTLSQSAASVGRKLMGRWVYSLSGIVSIPASTWTVTYRAMRSASASLVVAHGDIDILIRKSDNTIGTTIATNVANSPAITLINAWETLTGTYNWLGYTVVDQTDYLEVAYYIEVTTSQSSKYVRLLVDDSTLPLADQTKIKNVMFTYPNQAPVASFTFSPSNPLIYDTVTFDASASYDSDGSIVSYKWDFGDGNITTVVTNPIITHVYTTAMSTVNYTVTLTVTDNEGLTGSVTQIVPVTNPSILLVSLPAGTYVGPHPDHWLSQCWLLDITGLSGTFTLRISNGHTSIASYDTHLIIALNNASYQYLNSLTVNTTAIPKSSFVYGTPKPYGFTLTWEEDVYPTWFSDIYVVGTIAPKGYKDVQVSVAFTNTTGARMHFDSYGSTVDPPPPTKKGHVTHNPHEKDSTVLFSPPTVVKYQLTVRTSGLGTYVTNVYNDTTILGTATDVTPYTGLFDEGSLILLNIDSPITDGSKRFVFTEWSGDATDSNRPVSVSMNSAKDITANYKTQYQITVTASPSGAIGGTFKVTYTQCGTTYTNVLKTTSWTDWADADTTVTVSEPQDIISVSSDTRYKFESYNPSSSVTMNQAKTITLVYKTQYYLTVNTNPAEVLTLNPAAVSGQGWYDSGATATVNAVQIVDKVSGQSRYDFRSWTGATPTGIGNQATVLMDGPKTATANYQLQYYLTVTSPYDAVGGQGWYDNGATAYATLNTGLVDHGNGTRRVFTQWSGDASGTNYAQSNAITMNGPKTAIANWKTQYKFTLRTNGLGTKTTNVYNSTTALGTATDATPYTNWFDQNAAIQLNIDSPITASPTRYVFTQWTGGASGSTRPLSVTMTAPKDITANYKTQHLLTVLTSPSGLSPQPSRNPAGEAGPANGWWYDSGTSVALTAQAVAGYSFSYWNVDGTPKGSGVNPISVTMNAQHIATAHYNPMPLSVSITPPSASIALGESVFFSSTVGGGTSPYTYQWHVNGNPVPGATSNTWTFTPAASRTYLVYLKVTDHDGNTVQSSNSTVYVSSGPVGGYTLPSVQKDPKTPLLCYALSLAIFAAAISLIRRKRK